jgi:hypothetical protein
MDRRVMLTFAFGAFCVWQYTGDHHAKHAFLLVLAIETGRLVMKFTRHRRQWAKYVICFFMQELMLFSLVLPIHFSGVTSKFSGKHSSLLEVDPLIER